MFRKKKFFLFLLIISCSLTISLGCSSLPKDLSYEKFSDYAQEAHDYALDEQDKSNDGQFATLNNFFKNLDDRLVYSNSYRIISETVQWGGLEPEIVFLGESVHNKNNKAFIFVPPLIDEDFPTIEDDGKYKVYRLDQDSSFGQKTIALLKSIVGNPKKCITIYRAESDDEDVARSVLAVKLLDAYKARRPKKRPKKEIKKEPKEITKPASKAKSVKSKKKK